jgi:hypothetical protein
LNRWIGKLSAAAMLVATFALIERDILPQYRTGDPPPNESVLLQPGEERHAQVGIYDADGRPVGKSWTRSRRTSANGLVIVLTTTVLEPMSVGTIATPRVRVETELTFKSNELTVDELDFRMFGLPVDISMHARRCPRANSRWNGASATSAARTSSTRGRRQRLAMSSARSTGCPTCTSAARGSSSCWIP